MKTPIKNFNEVLFKLQIITPDDDNYDWYWELFIQKYRKLIYKTIGINDQKHDFFQDIMLRVQVGRLIL